MDNNDIRSYRILRKFKLVSLVNAMLIFKDDGFRGIRNKLKSKKIKEIKINNPDFKKGKVLIVLDENCSEKNLLKLLNDSKEYQIYKINSNHQDKIIKSISYEEFQNLFRYKAFIFISKKRKDLSEFFFVENILFSCKINEEINELLSSTRGLKFYANYENKDVISVKASTFFDFEGSNYYSGGAERYLIDLHEICKELGTNLDIYQNADIPFFRKYNGINVIGMPLKNQKIEYSERFFKKQSTNYKYLTMFNSSLHIYSAFNEAFPVVASPSIGISHGVSWDSNTNVATDAIDFWRSKYIFIKSAELCDRLVSVDTNTANWFQTVDYNLGNQKFDVIPNYVDTKEFKPRKDYLKLNKRIKITYPRRLYEPRGLYLALNIASRIIDKYPNVEFHFVGKGFKKDLDAVEEVRKKYPKNIYCYSKSPYEMHEVYESTDISLIPTLYSEGTSLSCLEAMASGNVVIANRIGGLTDLIINGYNGYLIEPDEESMFETLNHILTNYEEVEKIKKRAVESAKVFNKSIWKDRWKKVLSEFELKKSENNDLIEIYLESIENINDKVYKILKEELNNNNLVYVRCEKLENKEFYEGQLLQIIDINDEIVSTAKKVYSTKSMAKKYKLDNYEEI